MLRRSACGMKRRVVDRASARPALGIRERASAAETAAARSKRAQELIVSPCSSRGCSAELTRSEFTSQKQRPKLPPAERNGGAMSADQNIAYVSAISLLELYRKRALSPVEAT